MNQNMETKTLAMTKATTKMRKPRMGKAKKISVTLSLMMKLMMAGKVPVEVVNTIINMVVPKDELRKAVAMASGFLKDGLAKREIYNLRMVRAPLGVGGPRWSGDLWNDHIRCLNIARDTILEVTKKHKHLILDKRRYTKASFNLRRYSGDEWAAAMYGGFDTVQRQIMIMAERTSVDGVDTLIGVALRELSAWI
jgi:hypothetical protein